MDNILLLCTTHLIMYICIKLKENKKKCAKKDYNWIFWYRNWQTRSFTYFFCRIFKFFTQEYQLMEHFILKIFECILFCLKNNWVYMFIMKAIFGSQLSKLSNSSIIYNEISCISRKKQVYWENRWKSNWAIRQSRLKVCYFVLFWYSCNRTQDGCIAFKPCCA